MQVCNAEASQVLFAFNRWGGAGGLADLGIGNRAGNYLDWIFAQNATSYIVKTLQVFVLPTPPPLSINRAHFTGPSQFSLSWEAQAGATYSVYKKLGLDSPAWTRIGEVTAISNTAAFTDYQSTDATSFYRITEP